MTVKRSRVNKYASLREEVLHESNNQIESKELSAFANQLHAIDKNQFTEMKVDETANYHSPLHVRNEFYSYQKETIEPKIIQPAEPVSQDTSSYSVNYIDDVIKEVKQYNLNKGYRNHIDTRSNVLNELKIKTDILRPYGTTKTEKPAVLQAVEEQVVEEIGSTDSENTQQFDITDIKEPEIQKPVFDETILMKVAQYAEDSSETYLDQEDFTEPNPATQQLFEQTQELKTQVNRQANEIQSMNSKMSRTNFVLNILLVLVSVAVLVILFFLVYMFLKVNQVI